jgi:hypothetical protein
MVLEVSDLFLYQVIVNTAIRVSHFVVLIFEAASLSLIVDLIAVMNVASVWDKLLVYQVFPKKSSGLREYTTATYSRLLLRGVHHSYL